MLSVHKNRDGKNKQTNKQTQHKSNKQETNKLQCAETSYVCYPSVVKNKENKICQGNIKCSKKHFKNPVPERIETPGWYNKAEVTSQHKGTNEVYMKTSK